MKILVIKPSSLGDIFHTLPAVRILKDQIPKCHITWLISDQFYELSKLFSDVDEFIFFKRKHWSKVANFGDLVRFLVSLRHRYFDYVIDFQGLFRSGLCTFFANSPAKYGFSHAREFAQISYSKQIRIPPDIIHAVEKNIFLVQQVFNIFGNYLAPRFIENQNWESDANNLLCENNIADDAKLIAIAPATRWPSKTWPQRHFSETISMLNAKAQSRITFWILGSDTESDIGNAIIESCRAENVNNLMGKTSLPVMVQLLKKSSMLLTNDSGPMHIAAALQIPTVSFFGPTDPLKTGPYGDIHKIFKSEVSCSPCFKRNCPLPQQLCLSDVMTPLSVTQYIQSEIFGDC